MVSDEQAAAIGRIMGAVLSCEVVKTVNGVDIYEMVMRAESKKNIEGYRRYITVKPIKIFKTQKEAEDALRSL